MRFKSDEEGVALIKVPSVSETKVELKPNYSPASHRASGDKST